MIDLLTATQAWEERQIRKRGEAIVRSAVSQDEELILNRKLQGMALGSYTLNADEQALLARFQAITLAAQQIVAQAKADNALLQDILAYEQAVRAVAELTLLIEGRAEVPAAEEVPEEMDPETGEVTQEYVPAQPAIPAIESLSLTVETVDEQGEPVTVDNPVYLQAIADRDAAQAIINSATAEVLDWVRQRS